MFEFLAKETLSFLPDVIILPLAGLTGPRSWPSQITARSTSVTSLERKILTATSLRAQTQNNTEGFVDGRDVCTGVMKQNCCSHTDALSSKHIFENFSQISHVCWESVSKIFYYCSLVEGCYVVSDNAGHVIVFIG